MGLFDRWRRVKKDQKDAEVKKREHDTYHPKSTSTIERKKVEGLSPVESGEAARLIDEAKILVKKRKELQIDRSDLLKKLDGGEISAIEFRKELMVITQEGAQVSEDLRRVYSRLKILGHSSVASRRT